MIKNFSVEVTVLMPVFNSGLYVKEAIASILNQSFTNFEFLIINDGSTDASDEIIRSFTDIRINYIDRKTNSGIVTVLNEGLRLSKGKYIARMDADDIAHPNRLKKQFHFLQSNPTYKLCGSNAIYMDYTGKRSCKLRRPKYNDEIKVFQLFRNAFVHPAIMADTAIIKSFAYQEEYKYAEDYFLFSQIVMQHKSFNLNSAELSYRIHEESISSKKIKEMMQSEIKTMAFLLSFLFKEISEETLEIHHSFLRPQNPTHNIKAIENHLIAIKIANRKKHIYNPHILEKQLQKEWYLSLLKSSEKQRILTFISSKLFSIKNLNIKQLIKLSFG
ncbi:glycosyltransferase family 2 protein [Pedobacter changchengzhani]|uniref:Glycosyltransferase family 2 protein n=1 Tax=Pedobacter changchengzhani TaxID=2529274 RepID=A0A4R5MNJ5_9SPHI|nr:glycosyltransferase family 2 protein [Pedobacter changchengzhani]TDG37146.1 glycosyltransferase family 2 protein [Pedobacter changchengzhani]